MKYLLSEICELKSGGTPRKSKSEYYGGEIPWVKIGDMENAKSGVIYKTQEYISKKGLESINNRLFEKGTLLLAMYGSVGKTVFAGTSLSTNQAILGITSKDKDVLNIKYLKYWFLYHKDFMIHQGRGVTLKNISATIVKRQKINLPDLQTQNQIVAALDKAQAIIDKRQKSIDLLDKIVRDSFLSMFEKYLQKSSINRIKLGDISNIVSGITKGRKTKETELYEVPYLRVANVQDNFFNLTEIKTIRATKRELEKYKLQRGDLLLTEGGDPDKLGRGGVWQMEINNLIYQNHLFRVRILDKSSHNEVFLSALISSNLGKQYFLKAAKQTSGIATINSRQLKAFPIPQVPVNLQIKYATGVEKILKLKAKLLDSSFTKINNLFQSLLQRAFHGDLEIDMDLQLDAIIANGDFKTLEKDDVLIQLLIDRFTFHNQKVKSKEYSYEDSDNDYFYETIEFYEKAKEALFHLLKKEKVIQQYDIENKKTKISLL